MHLKQDGPGAVSSREVRGAFRCGMELLTQLDDPDPATRRSAALDLIECSEAVYVLIAHLLKERDLSVREAILMTLLCLDDPEVVVYLMGFLLSDDSRLRNDALETLKEFPGHFSNLIHEALDSRSSGEPPAARRTSVMDRNPLEDA